MGTYFNRNHIRPETSTRAPAPDFSWFYPGRVVFSEKETSLGPSLGTDSDAQPQPQPQPALRVAPVSSISAAELRNYSRSKVTDAKKKKPSDKGSKPTISKSLGPKKQKKSSPKKKNAQSIIEAKREKNSFESLDVDMERTNFDLSQVPSPVCSCTGVPIVCYKWGASGWQSSCCTISTSEYPLPMSPKRPGTRIAGRKMTNGVYLKLLLRLATEGHDLSHPVDLKSHWARHGTNKHITIR